MTDLAERLSPDAGRSSGPVAEGTPASTTLPDRSQSGPPPRPRQLRSLSAGAFDAAGAVVAGLSVTLLLFGRLTPLTGLIGWVVVAFVSCLGVYALLVSLHESRQTVVDRVMTVLLGAACGLLVGVLVFILAYTFSRGWAAMHHLNFYTQDLSRAASLQPLTVGGIKHGIVGTLWMISIASIITIPLGLLTAVFLNEVGGRFARFVRTIVEAMTALPSILAGLFIFAVFILDLHFQYSGLAASLALAVDMLPIIIRAADVVLRLVPGTLREASAALGAPQRRTSMFVILPTAKSGLATAVLLGVARGLGETAPVLLTAGYTASLNTDPLHGPMVSLPLLAFDEIRTGIHTQQARGFGAASVLLILVLGLFLAARLIGGRGPGNLSPRQVRQAERASARDANRIIRSYSQHGSQP
jgi:phosphate transport system permease protein